MTERVRPTIKLRNLFYTPDASVPGREKVSPLDEDLGVEDAPFVQSMGVILFGTLLAMNARPQLLETGKLVKRVPARDDKPAREFWTPNVIGARYRPKREVPRIGSDGRFVFQPTGEHGTHASPRLHWRRGHFRNQPYGPKLSERRTIWLEPMLIGADE